MLTLQLTDRRSVERSLEQKVRQRTGRRLRDLRVEAIGPHVHLRAVSPSYYVKQLALQAAVEMRDDIGGLELQVDIDVCQARPPTLD